MTKPAVVTATQRLSEEFATFYRTVDGNLHREDGPAIEWANGAKEWYLHREDGPAIEWSDGTKTWYLHDQRYNKPEWLRVVLQDRPRTARQRELLDALPEN